VIEMKDDCYLAVNITAHYEYMKAPESVEEEMIRNQADTIVAELAYKLQDNFAEILRTVVDIQSRRG